MVKMLKGDRPTDRQADREKERNRDRGTETDTDRQTDTQRERQGQRYTIIYEGKGCVREDVKIAHLWYLRIPIEVSFKRFSFTFCQ